MATEAAFHNCKETFERAHVKDDTAYPTERGVPVRKSCVDVPCWLVSATETEDFSRRCSGWMHQYVSTDVPR